MAVGVAATVQKLCGLPLLQHGAACDSRVFSGDAIQRAPLIIIVSCCGVVEDSKYVFIVRCRDAAASASCNHHQVSNTHTISGWLKS